MITRAQAEVLAKLEEGARVHLSFPSYRCAFDDGGPEVKARVFDSLWCKAYIQLVSSTDRRNFFGITDKGRSALAGFRKQEAKV